MNPSAVPGAPRVAIVGGGLAGLAAAVALESTGCRIELFETRSQLGGRAASFRDPATGDLVDHCQHVSMGCCTNLADFCRRTGIDRFVRSHRELYFIGPDGRTFPLRAARWLPAPLHLLGGFWSLKYLSARDRIAIGRAVWQLMRRPLAEGVSAPTVGAWLREQRQSPAAVTGFWSVILTSALGEDLDRASLGAARKVIVDGFLSAREAYEVEIPQAPLGTLYGRHLESWLRERGVALHLAEPVRQVSRGAGELVVSAASDVPADYVIVAVPWSKVVGVVAPQIASQWPWLAAMGSAPAAPITGVHLWFDRAITDLPHAALIGRLSQWIFNRNTPAEDGATQSHYYQVVISASRALAERTRDQIVAEVCGELGSIWPATARAKLVAARVVTEHAAVFSVSPGLDAVRPAQQTPTAGVLVAGDWTATGWPSTMESAVRSGYLAAEAILAAEGRPRRLLVPDLPRGLLARTFIK
jgi:squalene-associated FAD-dependent desaturase